MYAVFAMERNPNSLRNWLQNAYSAEAGCPQPEAYLAAELDSLDPDSRKRLLDHAESCPACSIERDLAQSFDSATGDEVFDDEAEWARRLAELPTASPSTNRIPQNRETVEQRRTLRFPSLPKTLPATWRAAAAVALLVGGGFLAATWMAPPSLPDRPLAEAQRSARIELIAPAGDIVDVPEQFAWQGLDEADRYRLSLFRAEDRAPAWQQEVDVESIVAEPALLAQLQQRVRYTWQVEAFSADGQLLARSATSDFMIVTSRSDQSSFDSVEVDSIEEGDQP